MITESIEFTNTRGQLLSGRIYRDETPSQKGIIFSHGLFSSKDGYKITRLAGDIVNEGFTLMTFDFSFAGESEGNIADLSLLQEVDDLKHAVRFFKEQKISVLHLMGSSFGGAVTLLYAASPECTIDSLICIATPVNLLKLAHAMGVTDIESLPDDGVTIVEGLTLKNRFFRELLTVDMATAVRSIQIPALIIHGEKDTVVSVENARFFHDECPSFSKQVIIEGGDHNLTEERFLEAVRLSLVNWLQSQS